MSNEDDHALVNNDNSDAPPVPEIEKLLGPYSLPGVDFLEILEWEQRNIADLRAANKVIFDGWKLLVQKEIEIFQNTMAQTIAVARKQEKMESRAAFAKRGLKSALINMRELAYLATRYQHEAFAIIHRRMGEHVLELETSRRAKES